jgi:hypothetical protein
VFVSLLPFSLALPIRFGSCHAFVRLFARITSSLSGNHISGTIPSEIGSLSKLTSL